MEFRHLTRTAGRRATIKADAFALVGLLGNDAGHEEGEASYAPRWSCRPRRAPRASQQPGRGAPSPRQDAVAQGDCRKRGGAGASQGWVARSTGGLAKEGRRGGGVKEPTRWRRSGQGCRRRSAAGHLALAAPWPRRRRRQRGEVITAAREECAYPRRPVRRSRAGAKTASSSTRWPICASPPGGDAFLHPRRGLVSSPWLLVPAPAKREISAEESSSRAISGRRGQAQLADHGR